MTPDEYCREKAAAHGSSLYYSFLFLPSDQRRAVTALYAFCREVDEVIDECVDASVAAAKLAWWRNEVAALYDGAPQHPVTRALAPVIGTFDIPASRLGEILDGMEMDLHHARYPDFSSLERYCYLVAGVVCIIAAGIFGHTNPQTHEYAQALGIALELTEIVRDVGADARKNRIYLPMDELARFEVSAADILHARHTEAFGRLMSFQVERAARQYDRALALLPPEDRRAQRPGLVMAAIHRTLLDEIRRDGSRVLAHRIALTPVRKLWIAWRTWVFA